MDFEEVKNKLLENKEVREEYERLSKIKCMKCKYYRKIYIHPWSVNILDNLKGTYNGFACILPLDEEYLKSFNGKSFGPSDKRIDVMIGKTNCIGCECFEEA